MDYGRAMAALRRRKWLIACAVLACTFLTAFGSLRMKREYQATATLMPQEQALETIGDMTTPAEAGRERGDLLTANDRIKTVATVLSSPAVLQPVIKKLHLNTTPALLSEQIAVTPETSQILRVNVKDEDAERASAIVNTLVDTFVRFYAGIRSQEARRQLESTQRERDRAAREVETAANRLHSYRQTHRIPDFEQQIRLIHDQAGKVEEQRNTADAHLREVSAQIGAVSSQLASTPATRTITESQTNAALLAKLQLDVSELQSQLDRELGSHTEEHPNVIRLKEQLSQARSRLTTEQSRLGQSVRIVQNPDRELLLAKLRDLKSDRDGTQARVEDLTQRLGSIRGQLTGLTGADVDLGVLTQTYTLAQGNLEKMENRLGQLRAATALLSAGAPIAVVDRTGPGNPAADLSQGRTLRLTALAFVMSLGMCVALAICLEMSDHRIRSVADVESFTQLPVVSVVPGLARGADAANLCLAADIDPSSHLAESYHFLANHILRQTRHRESTVIMGVTARPGQGATTSLCNLAIALARAGRQVVLVEADLRRPFLQQVFLGDHKFGLSDVLRDEVKVREALVPSHVDNLQVLHAGGAARDPWSLLWQPTMGTTIEALREAADYVIVNVPSATVFADALCVAPHVDGAILVMRTSEVPNGADQKVRQWLDEVEVPVMGVVLNGVPAADMESFDFHRSYASRASRTAPALAPGAGLIPGLKRAA